MSSNDAPGSHKRSFKISHIDNTPYFKTFLSYFIFDCKLNICECSIINNIIKNPHTNNYLVSMICICDDIMWPWCVDESGWAPHSRAAYLILENDDSKGVVVLVFQSIQIFSNRELLLEMCFCNQCWGEAIHILAYGMFKRVR